jgi:hypothetical protein
MGCEIKVLHVNTLGDYFKYINVHELLETHWVFRGQQCGCENLLPRLGRGKDTHWRGVPYERESFKTFKRALPLHGLYLNQLTDIDILSIAQHYNLETRLLDWSLNPFVGMYFACDKGYKEDDYSVVYACKFTDESYSGFFIAQRVVDFDPFEVKEIKVYVPDFIDKRIYSQRGCFTVHPVDKLDNGVIGINKDTSCLLEMIEFRVHNISLLRDGLEKIGISPFSVYNTLEETAGYVDSMKWSIK